jgi:hypothetical protein
MKDTKDRLGCQMSSISSHLDCVMLGVSDAVGCLNTASYFVGDLQRNPIEVILMEQGSAMGMTLLSLIKKNPNGYLVIACHCRYILMCCYLITI